MSRCPFSQADWPLDQSSFLSVASFSVESLAVASLATASLLAAVDFAGCSGFCARALAFRLCLSSTTQRFFLDSHIRYLIAARAWARVRHDTD